MEYLTLGKIVKTFGIKGEIKVLSSTHFQKQRYRPGQHVYVWKEDTDERKKVTIQSHRTDGQFDILKMKEYSSIDAWKDWIPAYVQVIKDPSFLQPGNYFYSDLLGCSICDEQNHPLGTVKKIEEYARYVTLRVARKEQKDILIPFVEAFISHVDIEKKIITIHLWEGLL